MGTSETLKKLWESHTPDKRELVVLARVHQVKMQAKVSKDNAMLDTHEEVEIETSEEARTIAEEDRKKGAQKRRKSPRCR